ncbi:hypothetical protein [Helicobacter fennelliae]|uniref:portal protein n=1 Tax=Helicobacter fennelliae TaxID=215 RepID=UPI000E0FB517|nr:hypothetical protein [Helicobacter fennelliae]
MIACSASCSADKLLYQKVISFIQHYFTKAQVFAITDKKRGDRYFEINTNAENAIKVGKFDLVYSTQLKTQGREERFAHWSEILKTIASIRPDIISNLLPLMLKDTDSAVVEDIEEVLAQSDESIAKNQEAQAQTQAQTQELEMAKLKAQIDEINAKVLKMQSQAKLLESAQMQMQSQSENTNQNTNPAPNANKGFENIPPQARKYMQISKDDMR